MLVHKRLDELGDLVLLVTRQPACLLQYSMKLADGTATRFSARLPEQMFNGDVEHYRRFFDLLRTQGHGVSFPHGVSLLGDAQLLRHLDLGQSRMALR